jgi:hypothetical protein
MISRENCPRRGQQVISQKAADELFLFNMEDGTYYSLNEIGGRIWELCDGAHSVSQVVETLAAEYGAPEEVLEQDVAELLADLQTGRLIV